jgi:hypothetical protein
MTTFLVALILAAQPPAGAVEGGITFYPASEFEGQPLKCPGYRYEPETGPWLALDINWYRTGRVRCGDWFLVHFADGSNMLARALDSGNLADYRVFDSGLAFVADLPSYWRDGCKTGTGWILNLSAMKGKVWH